MHAQLQNMIFLYTLNSALDLVDAHPYSNPVHCCLLSFEPRVSHDALATRLDDTGISKFFPATTHCCSPRPFLLAYRFQSSVPDNSSLATIFFMVQLSHKMQPVLPMMQNFHAPLILVTYPHLAQWLTLRLHSTRGQPIC
jgi:hypothetical protein